MNDVDKTNDGFILNPYKLIVRRKILKSFAELNRRNSQELLSSLTDHVIYKFEGDHALGGERTSKQGVANWFQRLFRLLPGQFDVLLILIKGMPWDTDVIVEFSDYVTPAFGEPYVNFGIQRIKIRLGKIIHIHTNADTDKIVKALNTLVINGIEEANAPQLRE